MPSIHQTICLLTPYDFYAVGQFYNEFDQVDDKEVVELLKKANNQFLINS
jgi:putative phosphoribosyl transferase